MDLDQDKQKIQALVSGIKAGNEQSFSEMYDMFSPALFGLITTIVRSENIASDLLQESMVKVWRNIESYNPQKGSFFTWMLNISRNTAIDHLRRSKNKSDVEIQKLSDNVGMQSDMKINTDTMGMREILNNLPEEHQILIDYVYFRGFTQKEVSDELDIPLGTVKTRIRAAVKELRKWFRLLIFWI